MNELFTPLNTLHWPAFFSASGASYLLILAAEMGDKSQLVCMALAARYRKAGPVMLGAALAFLLLNTLAVLFGAAITHWLPDSLIAAVVTLLFAAFGIHALRAAEEEDAAVQERLTTTSRQGFLLATFLLITVAEFGDKTQLAVVAMSSTYLPLAVWAGATLALLTTTALGIWVGRTLLTRMPMHLLHRLSGVLFLVLAALAAWQTYRLLASP